MYPRGQKEGAPNRHFLANLERIDLGLSLARKLESPCNRKED